MKKLLIILTVALVVVVGIVFIAIPIFHKDDGSAASEDNEDIFALTEQEVDRINANSNLLSCVLLSDAPEDSITAGPTSIRRDTSDYYLCFPYRGAQYITSINLVSEDADILGISVGDTVKNANAILLNEGYLQQESAPDNSHIYRKHYICITYKFNEDEILIELGISVQDPAYNNIDY